MVDRRGTRHAYDLYVSASTGEHLDAVYPVFEHMLNTFALEDSAIATPPPSGTAPPGSTLPLDDAGTAAPDLTGPKQAVRHFYSWYLTQANGQMCQRVTTSSGRITKRSTRIART